MRFEFMTANRILFGPGTLREIGSAAVSLGRRALVVTGVETSRAAPLLEQLEGQKLAYTLFTVEHEPSIPLVQAGIQAAHNSATQAGPSFTVDSPFPVRSCATST